MHYVVTLKVYKEINGDFEKKWYRVKNGKKVLEMDICSGDTINIDGVGKLEVFGVHYQSREEGKNPYRSLELTCGIIGSQVIIRGNMVTL